MEETDRMLMLEPTEFLFHVLKKNKSMKPEEKFAILAEVGVLNEEEEWSYADAKIENLVAPYGGSRMLHPRKQLVLVEQFGDLLESCRSRRQESYIDLAQRVVIKLIKACAFLRPKLKGSSQPIDQLFDQCVAELSFLSRDAAVAAVEGVDGRGEKQCASEDDGIIPRVGRGSTVDESVLDDMFLRIVDLVQSPFLAGNRSRQSMVLETALALTATTVEESIPGLGLERRYKEILGLLKKEQIIEA